MMDRLALTWEISQVSGWGVFGLNLTLGLLERGKPKPLLLTPPNLMGLEVGAKKALSPLMAEQVSLTLRPEPVKLESTLVLESLHNGLSGAEVLDRYAYDQRAGMVFFEDTHIDPTALERARTYPTIFAGSTWNSEVLQSKGLGNIEVLLQGIDPVRFQPRPPTGQFKDRFVIFSGGKLEHRKGQDLVIAAYKIFQQRHPEALLLTAWNNLWPDSVGTITQGGYVEAAPVFDTQGHPMIEPWLLDCGLPPGSFADLGLISNAHMPDVYREADVALFPNRAEGGTNLVAMECLASGVPTILSANTGHLDLIRDGTCLPLNTQTPLPGPHTEGWGGSDVEEIVSALETLHGDHARRKALAAGGVEFMGQMTWAHTLDGLLYHAEKW